MLWECEHGTEKNIKNWLLRQHQLYLAALPCPFTLLQSDWQLKFPFAVNRFTEVFIKLCELIAKIGVKPSPHYSC